LRHLKLVVVMEVALLWVMALTKTAVAAMEVVKIGLEMEVVKIVAAMAVVKLGILGTAVASRVVTVGLVAEANRELPMALSQVAIAREALMAP
jgi:hypothetical protein